MKTVLLHGLGQTAQDWKEVVQQLSISDVDCPELFSSTEDEISYLKILGDLEQRYSEVKEPLRICGLSLGALLAIDFAIRHEEKVASLVLIGAQYRVCLLYTSCRFRFADRAAGAGGRWTPDADRGRRAEFCWRLFYHRPVFARTEERPPHGGSGG